MKSMFQIIAAVACVAALTACGGGSKRPVVVVVPQPDFKLTETVVGAGTTNDTLAQTGDLVVINYNGYLYDSTKADGKGAKVESSYDTGKTAPPFIVGVGAVITGWDQTVLGTTGQNLGGMRVGGKRTAILPTNLAYGALAHDALAPVNGITYAAIPANSPLVYDIELVSITKASTFVPPTVTPPTVTTIKELTVGTGAVAVAGSKVTVNYTGWLYDGTRITTDFKGARFDPDPTSTNTTSNAQFTVGTGTITGFATGLTGMAVGGTRRVTIPPDQGYGAAGSGKVPGNATLIFEIQLVSIN